MSKRTYDYAIVVGINHYPAEAIAPLRGAVNDAIAFRNWLKDPTGGNLPEENIFQVLSSDFDQGDLSLFDAKPTNSEVERHFKFFLKKAYNSDDYKVGRRLYLFFSGHGYTFQDVDESALILADADPDTILSHFPGRAAAKQLVRGGIFEELILFMDCCRENYKRQLSNLTWKVLDQPERQVKTFYAFASQWGFKTRERKVPNSAPERYEGMFTRALLDTLKEGKEKGLQMSSGRLKQGIKTNLKRIAAESELPYFDPDILFQEEEEILFLEGEQALTSDVSVHIQDFDDVEIECLDGRFELVEKGVGALDLMLSPGLYLIRYHLGNGPVEEILRIDPGMTHQEVQRAQFVKDQARIALNNERSLGKSQLELVDHHRMDLFDADERSGVLIFIERFDEVTDANILPVFSLINLNDGSKYDWNEIASTDLPEIHYHLIGVAVNANCKLVVQLEEQVIELMIPWLENWESHFYLEIDEDGALDLLTLQNLLVPYRSNIIASNFRLDRITKGINGNQYNTALFDEALGHVLKKDIQNPILSIHWLFSQWQVGHMKSVLAEEVLENLEGIIPRHPDVRILRLWYELNVKRTNATMLIPRYRFSFPPQFRVSWRILLDLQKTHSSLISGNSLAGLIAPHIWGDLIWLLWSSDPSLDVQVNVPALTSKRFSFIESHEGEEALQIDEFVRKIYNRALSADKVFPEFTADERGIINYLLDYVLDRLLESKTITQDKSIRPFLGEVLLDDDKNGWFKKWVQAVFLKIPEAQQAEYWGQIDLGDLHETQQKLSQEIETINLSKLTFKSLGQHFDLPESSIKDLIWQLNNKLDSEL